MTDTPERDVVERLNEANPMEMWPPKISALMEEAADTITSLRAQLREARAAIERLRTYGENMRLVCAAQSERIRELDPTAPVAEAIRAQQQIGAEREG